MQECVCFVASPNFEAHSVLQANTLSIYFALRKTGFIGYPSSVYPVICPKVIYNNFGDL
jgi:hypothetical protein